MTETTALSPELERRSDGAGDLPADSDLLAMYQPMLMRSLADDRARDEAKAGRLQAAFYPVRGLEAVCAALGQVLRPTDQLVSTYRNLGDALAKNVNLRAIIAELFRRVDGTSKGKGGADASSRHVRWLHDDDRHRGVGPTHRFGPGPGRHARRQRPCRRRDVR